MFDRRVCINGIVLIMHYLKLKNSFKIFTLELWTKRILTFQIYKRNCKELLLQVNDCVQSNKNDHQHNHEDREQWKICKKRGESSVLILKTYMAD